MLKKITLILLLITSISFSQSISVDDSSYTATDLANLLLQGSCIDPTEVSYSSGQSVAYFNQNGSAFPINEGVIIRTGIATYTEGNYTNTNLSSQINSNTDPDLQDISNNSGQNSPITDTAFLQFNFIPISSDFNFNFIFASNEYGEYQCGFSDVFAFLLTDLSTGTTTNLAVLPSTTTPISVLTIRDNTYNSGCTSENPELFSTYNVNNPAASTINMRGHTTVLNASSTLIPDGRTYRIRMVIGDYSNPDFDSAVLIDAGDFITPLDIGDDTSICDGNSITVSTNLDDIEYTHSWTLNGTPQTETSNSLTITQAGTYTVTATKNGCELTDTIVVSDLNIGTPNNLQACDDGTGNFSYNLTNNNESVLGIDDTIYDVHYFASQADIPNNPIPTGSTANYISSGNETIYIKIFNIATNTYCNAELPFDLTVNQATEATPPNDVQLCNIGDTVSTDLTLLNNEILGALPPSNFTITYFETETDAQNNQNPIGNIYTTSINNSPQTLWVLLQNNQNPECFDIVSFNIIVNPLPVVANLDDTIECSSYTLPPIDDVDGDGIPDGNYYDGPDGTGNMLNVGDVINDGGTYYIYNGPDANGCYNQSSFTLTFIDEYNVEQFHCGEFSVPILPPGNFYTETNGPNGTGTIIDPSTVFTSANLPLTVHYYAETIDPTTGASVVCRNEAFDITIYDLPPVDNPENVVTCINYTLPALINGNYYSQSGGTGTALTAGDNITSSGTYYVYNTETHNVGTTDEITCTNETSFEITIINQPTDVNTCDSYTLPALTVGEYYDTPGGAGNLIPAGTTYTYDVASPNNNTYDIYVYAETTPTTPPSANCTDNYMFTLTIYPTPEVDQLGDENGNITRCINNPFVLPNLTNGNYYDASGGPSAANPIAELTEINTVGFHTFYIYNEVNGCPAESSFTVEIRDLPLVDNFTDVFICNDVYTLPELDNGAYFTLPGGVNDSAFPILEAGSIIDATQTIYIYNNWDDLETCSSETIFTVNILGVDLGEDQTINRCDTDNYTLPTLSVGDYYTAPNGVGLITPSNYLYNTPGSYTVYIFNDSGDREPCINEVELTINISETPTLPAFSDEVVCGNYQLNDFSTSGYNVAYYTDPERQNLITDLNLTTPGEHTIYVYATAINNTNCYDEATFTVTIHPLLDLNIQGGIICVDPETGETLQPILLESNLDENIYTIDWYLNGTIIASGANHLATSAGTYTVVTSIINPVTPPQPGDCNYQETEVVVTASSQAIATYSVTEDFDDYAVITVHITGGLGQYNYQLNDGLIQESNQFFNVNSGDHIITIIDTLGGCEVTILEVTVIKYPKFFTPNGDGVNDTWNILDLSDQPEATIQIFDRFGKFITQIYPSQRGWDGTYNGNKLFSSDYWFVITYKDRNNNDKEFKAHFSLKR